MTFLVRLRPSSRALRLAGLAGILFMETALAGLGAWQWSEARELRRSEERRRLALGDGTGLSGASDALAAEALRAAGRARAAVREACGVRPPPPPPASRAQAFFELSEFVEAQRARAAAAGVALREGERFGFASHLRQGPSPAMGARVVRQKDAVAAVLEPLWLARPHRLESVQREDPEHGRATRRGPGDEIDFMGAPPAASFELPAGVVVEQLRISVVGHSRALRRWLNRLAGLPGPVVVRDVRVEPWRAGARADGEAAFPDAVRFTVTVAVAFSNLEDGPAPSEAPARPAS